MEKVRKPEKNEKAAARRYGLIVLLILAFIAAVTAVSIIMPSEPAEPLSFGFVPEPRAYCTFGLGADAPVDVISYENYEDLIAGLNGDGPDAALLPAQYLDQIEDGRYTAAAVVCYLNLVGVENGGSVYSVADLNGRRIVMPEALTGTPEERMLDALLSKAGVTADISYADDDAVSGMAQSGDFDIMLLPADKYATLFPAGGELTNTFNLAHQWSFVFGTRPPAGLCLVVRTETMERRAGDVLNMLSKIRAAVNFLRTSHKKAAVLVSAGGFNEDIDYIRRTISHCMFEYLDGDAETEALEQLNGLLAGP